MIGRVIPAARRPVRGLPVVNLPNLISIARLFLVPVVIVALVAGRWDLAFGCFVVAGVSDAVDGFLARRFDQRTELGAYIDPLADKALLVSIYVTLAVVGAVPGWLAVIVVSRDVMIVGAVMLSWLLGRPVEIRPLGVSKLNTGAQIAFAGLVLGARALDVEATPTAMLAWGLGIGLVAVLTLASAAAYLAAWLAHMSEEPHGLDRP